MGYSPGIIRHHYHGKKANRKYVERNEVIINHQYSPSIHVKYDEIGVLVPTENFSDEFKEDIMKYFEERKEDE